MMCQFLGKVDDKTTCLLLRPKLNLSQPAGQEAIYLRETLTDSGFSQIKATLLYEDNLACVAMSENPVRRKFSCHIDIRKYYVRELVLNGFLKLAPLRTHKIVADALTKSLPSPAFVGHRQIMTGHTSFAAKLLRCVGV